MKKAKLKNYLEKYVEIILFDGSVIEGILHRYTIHNGNKTKFRYFCTDVEKEENSCDFKLSDIKEISRIKIKTEKIDNELHAQWAVSKFADDFYRCTRCSSVWNRTFDFCPSCGAKTDKE